MLSLQFNQKDSYIVVVQIQQNTHKTKELMEHFGRDPLD